MIVSATKYRRPNPESVVDGPGIRFVIFAQGCQHNCKGCFNPELQPFQQNRLMTVEEIIAMIKEHNSQGITFSGGDPLNKQKALQL